MTENNKRLTILSDAERFALYGLPDFDDGQRQQYLSFSECELGLVMSRQSLHAQVHCALQIGYFKAKYAFFSFFWEETEEDCAFILTRYFHGQAFAPQPVTEYEHYVQRTAILGLFDYRPWSAEFLLLLAERAAQVVHRDVTPGFIVAELVAFLHEQKIVRPGHTTLQTLISDTLTTERNRLSDLLDNLLDEPAKEALQQLLVHDDTLLGLAALKQDAKDFGYRQMVSERKKRTLLEPLYQTAKAMLPILSISRQNLNYYASLANFYTIYDLRRLRPKQTYLYLLCFAWQRYRQLTDNLMDAMDYHMKQLEDETKIRAKKRFFLLQSTRRQESPGVGRLLLMYVDDNLADTTPFGSIRESAFTIMPKDELRLTGQRLCGAPVNKLELRWQIVEELAERARHHLRSLYVTLNFSSTVPDNPWLVALGWMTGVFSKQQRLAQRPLSECPAATIPKRLRPYLLEFDVKGNASGVRADRYEFWVYRQIRKRCKSGEVYLDDSVQHRSLSDELVSLEEKAAALGQLDIPWLRQPIETQINALTEELHRLWLAFDKDLRQGKLKNLEYDSQTKTLVWRRPKVGDDEAKQDAFYGKLSFRDIADVLRFVNEQCHFLSALTPLQPRYAKQVADTDSLMAVIMAQAMNHGNLTMAQTSDIPYHVLDATYLQYLRLASLQAANDVISNATADLAIFPHYSFGLEALYGSVDGQKFGVERPTVKARFSRKYFGRGKGVVAYTLLCNHVPLQGWLIGAHELEGHHVFDLWYHNTSDIVPTVITGDMHSINKANFAILHCFGLRFEPRLTRLHEQIQQIYCAGDPARYEKFLIQPTGQIDLQAVINEKSNIDQIVATLGLKEMSQGTLIRKLCTYTQPNPTRYALFEFDKLIRSTYTLRYARDPQLQRNIHRSQNRIESYHQMRSAIAQVGGKKELTGRTDIEVEISNQCARLVANAIIYYNSAILSRLLAKYGANPSHRVLSLIKKISPVAWRHIHMGGHYTFRGEGKAVDLDALVADLLLE